MSRENKNEERSETLRKTKKQKEKENLLAYLKTIPKLPSHYCRKQTDKLYLEPLFITMTQFFDHYKDYCNEKHRCHTVVSNEKISIFHPKKDACNICIKHHIENIKEDELARQEKSEEQG